MLKNLKKPQRFSLVKLNVEIWDLFIFQKKMVIIFSYLGWKTHKTGIIKLPYKNLLLQISRGYITISTDALTTITGITAIAIIPKYENSLINILHLKQEKMSSTHTPNTTIQHKDCSWQIHPGGETYHFLVSTTLNSYTPADRLGIFTVGTRTDTLMW